MTRQMTHQLEAAIDAMAAGDRRALKELATESKSPWLRGLLCGIRAELDIDEQREAEAQAASEAVHRAR
jgi:hypothetical protein